YPVQSCRTSGCLAIYRYRVAGPCHSTVTPACSMLFPSILCPIVKDRSSSTRQRVFVKFPFFTVSKLLIYLSFLTLVYRFTTNTKYIRALSIGVFCHIENNASA